MEPTLENKIWALEEAAKQGGFMPHAKLTADLLFSLEREGLVRESDVGPFFAITDAGRAFLSQQITSEGK